MNSKSLVAVLLGAGLALGLAACSSNESKPSPTSSSVAAPTAPIADADVLVPDEKSTGTCTDDVATIDQSNTEVTLDGACKKVVVTASNAIVHLGDVQELEVSGALTRVTVETADTVLISGSGNDVLWSVEKPIAVDDRGEQNFVVQDTTTKEKPRK